MKKRPNAILSGIEREEGELKQRFGRANTYTYSHHIHTRIHTHTDIPMDYIRSLKAADTNEPIQERIKNKAQKTPINYTIIIKLANFN